MDQFNTDENNNEAQQPEETADETNNETQQPENTAGESIGERKSNVIDVLDNINIPSAYSTPMQEQPAPVIEENKAFAEEIPDIYHKEMQGTQPRPAPNGSPYGMPPDPYAVPPYSGGYGNNNNNNNGCGGYPPRNNGMNGSWNGYPGQTPRPAYAAYGAAAPQKKKSLSNGGIAAIILTVSALFIVIIVILAVSAVSSPAVSEDSSTVSVKNDGSSGITVEIPVSPKPDVDGKYYADEETGLLTVQGVAKQVSPSVVDVMVYRDTSLYPYSTGSGIIISSDGYIVTNAHVVSDVNAGLKVILDNDEEYKAEIVGQDNRTDIAVLKIEADEELVSAELGDSDQLELGEMVVAIGNAGGYSGTLTVGYVSGLNREVRTNSGSDTMTCIQTDAAMSPGVSGGALINMYGQVVGITSSKYKNSDLDEGIGFAISTKFAKPIIEDIISLGYISGRVRVGITYTTIDDLAAEMYEAKRGLLIQSIDENCDISNTEAEPGDIITSINGYEVYSAQTVSEALEGCKPGDVIKAEIYRKGITDDDDEEFEIEFELMQDTSLS